ncbi:MAG: conjugal transfer protein TraX [Defluviitaleaceae bacterium]|nr:conjugal transfer protein TraX [Defluviitaleaceae bacterium]
MKFLSLDAYALKWIAVIGMIANHVAIAWHTILPLWLLLPLYAAGGLTYVIMAYFIVEGYRYTSNFKKYISRLLIFGLIAQAFHPMVLGSTAMIPGTIFLNILFNIALALVVLLLYDKIKIRFLFWLLFIVACVISFFMDLFFMGPLLPLLYYAIKKESKRRTLPGIIAGLVWGIFGLFTLMGMAAMMAKYPVEYVLENMGVGFGMEMVYAMPTFAIGCFLGAVLIRNYNGERGKPAKWLFYVAYPVHLAVIAAISLGLGLTTFSLFIG